MKSKVNTIGLSRPGSVCGLEAKMPARVPAGILRGRMFRNSFALFRLIGSLALILLLAQVSLGYSPLTHEAIIDSTWDDSIKPLLLTRFHSASADDLREARAYAYGGSLIQDMGYYPFSSKLFSDLVHYVRSGDFIVALLQESRDIKEYAFALGALSHYAADNNGHSIAVNQAVPVAYPKLRAKYGNEITYADDATSHIRVEFAFDVLQIARGHYAPQKYHDSIGFKVAKSMLERAFKNTYGIEMKEIFGSVDLAIGTYRRSMSMIIPLATKVAWEMKKDEIKNHVPGITSDRFVFSFSRASYEKEWGEQYEGGGVAAKTLAIFFRILPKVGPLKAFAFKPLTLETERMFILSFNTTLDQYRTLLDDVRAGQLDLPNRDFDTGRPTHMGEYQLADQAYAKLLNKLGGNKSVNASPDLCENIRMFYAEPSAPIAKRGGAHQVGRLPEGLLIRSISTSSQHEPGNPEGCAPEAVLRAARESLRRSRPPRSSSSRKAPNTESLRARMERSS